MSVPFTYVRLQRGSTIYTIATSINQPVTGQESYMLCVASEGLMTIGENDVEGLERSYSSGSVLPMAPRFQGKSFTIDVAFYSRNSSSANVKQRYKDFEAFLAGGTLDFTTDFPHNLDVQLQRVDIEAQDWVGTGRVIARYYFKAAQH